VESFFVAFRGSENPVGNLKDWTTDATQWGFGSLSVQYEKALILTKRAQIAADRNGYKLLGCTGHSLGGGLAALVALELGLYAITFNSAPIHQPTSKIAEDYIASHVQNYVSGKDFVSRLSPFV
jgi:predicted esterase YcpF (UPF0227 family)